MIRKKHKDKKYMDPAIRRAMSFLNEDPLERERTEMDASDGEDPLEMDENVERKFADSTDFYGNDEGRMAGGNTDIDDLPPELKRQTNRYDPGLTTGTPASHQKDEIEEHIHIDMERQIGASYDKDSYTEEEEIKDRKTRKKK